MQGASLLCSPNSCLSIHNSHLLLTAPSRKRPSGLGTASSHSQSPLGSFQSYTQSFVPLHRAALEDAVETITTEPGFVEIGYVISTHGLQGDVCVKPSTDFPELRFGQPGKRWIKQQYMSEERTQEVELLAGKEHAAKKGWILTFEGIDSVDQARLLVGSTVLVPEGERPELEEGEFYTPDLIGMRVILKETGEHVGTVVNIFNTGACDLLRVKLDDSADSTTSENGKPKSDEEADPSNHLVWIPFSASIVPDIDMERREMYITPPTGLLELNVRTHEKSKKERRKIEWRDKKRFQRQLIAAKKRLCEMEQQHVFDGFRFGEKSQGKLLADQIVGVNSTLLRIAMKNTEIPSKRWDGPELLNAVTTNLVKSAIKVSEGCLTSSASKEKLGANFNLRKKGLKLISKGKMGIVLILNGNSPCSLLQTLLSDDHKFVKVGDRTSVPLILVCPVHEIQAITELFLSNDYFAFDSEKVRFLEEERLPVVSSLLEEQDANKILMKSPWEMLQSPVGSGGVISVLSSHDIPKNLTELGVEYIQVCNLDQRHIGGSSLLLGLVDSHKAEIGIQIPEELQGLEEDINMVFSMDLMDKLVKHISKMQFTATIKSSSYVKKVDKDWVDVAPRSLNSFEFSSSIYGSLNACSLENVCVMQITE